MTLPRARLVSRHPLRVASSFVADLVRGLATAAYRLLPVVPFAMIVLLVVGVTAKSVVDRPNTYGTQDCFLLAPCDPPPSSTPTYRDLDPVQISDEDIRAAMEGRVPQSETRTQPTIWTAANNLLASMVLGDDAEACFVD